MIQLRKDSFSQDDIETYGSGAGIVMHSVDDRGRHLFLLGRERLSSWKGSCRWSGFEGSRKPDESLVDTAVREFREESLDSFLAADVMRSLLHDAGHELCVVLSVTSDRKEARYHRTYLVRSEWKGGVEVNAFDKMREHLDYLDRLIQEWTHFRPAILSDIDVARIETLSHGPPEPCRVRVSACLERDGSPSAVLTPPWEWNDGRLSAVVEGRDAEALLRWDCLRGRVDRAIIDHPAVVVRRAGEEEGASSLQEASVLRDHLEKDQARWWSDEELTDILDGHGTRGTERFRPYFLPVLQTILSELNLLPQHITASSRPEAGGEHRLSPRTPSPLQREELCAQCAPTRP